MELSIAIVLSILDIFQDFEMEQNLSHFIFLVESSSKSNYFESCNGS